MKRVTKKLVREALASFTGWNFAYSFKESQRIVLFSHFNIASAKETLSIAGVDVVECRPQEGLQTGYMKLVMAGAIKELPCK